MNFLGYPGSFAVYLMVDGFANDDFVLYLAHEKSIAFIDLGSRFGIWANSI